VDQHDVGHEWGQRREAGTNRALPGIGTEDRRQQVEAGAGLRKQANIIAMNDRLHGADFAVFGK